MAQRTGRIETLKIRLTLAEKRTLEAAANASGITVSEFVRNVALGDARRFVDLMRNLSPDSPSMSVEEVATKVRRLGLTRRDEASRLIRKDRDR